MPKRNKIVYYKVFKKIVAITGFTTLGLVLILALWWIWPERTPIIYSKEKAVAQIDYIPIGGIEQCVLIRSKNTDNPILLFLHGGPGMPMMYLGHEFQRPLENHFTVVHWDRRGAGKTYAHNRPDPQTINTHQIVEDAFTLIDTLMLRYNKEQLILVGHSFGTYISSIMVHQKPHLFKAYISIGQVVDGEKARIFQEDFIREKAQLLERTEIIKALDHAQKPDFENWLFEFGGELKDHTSFFPLIWSGLKSPEYTLSEVLQVAKGSSFSSSKMKLNLLTKPIGDTLSTYNVPVYFMVGRSDYTTPHELISKYYDQVEAPIKELIYFENSAHFPFFEEPDKFCKEVLRLVGE